MVQEETALQQDADGCLPSEVLKEQDLKDSLLHREPRYTVK